MFFEKNFRNLRGISREKFLKKRWNKFADKSCIFCEFVLLCSWINSKDGEGSLRLMPMRKIWNIFNLIFTKSR